MLTFIKKFFKQKHPGITKKQEPYYCGLCDQQFAEWVPLWDYFQKQLAAYGFDFERIRPEFRNPEKIRCPLCDAMDRDRIVAEYLVRRLGKGFTDKHFRLLEFAPRLPVAAFIQREFDIQHETADLYMENVNYRLDLAAMPEIETASINAWICCHVLEHIPDDTAALKELYRILKPGGFGCLLVPLSLGLETTDEDPTASVAERWRRFGQDDHVRMYAKHDFIERVQQAHFTLKQLDQQWFGKEYFTRLGLPKTAVLYVVEK